MDRAGKAHWDASWSGAPVPAPIDPESSALAKNVERTLGRLFDELFREAGARHMRLLEVGCARSAILPFFARRYGFVVAGLDYSEPGCELARLALERAGVSGEIHHGDMYAPPPELIERFDAVFSFGLVEHFEDTTRCVSALARFAKPGGVLLTIIPNMTGLLGTAQRILNESVYRIHVPLDREALRHSHVQAGLSVTRCEYLMSVNFGVINLQGVSLKTPVGLLKRMVTSALARSSYVVWAIERLFGREFPAVKAFSPYIYCVGTKPANSRASAVAGSP